MVVAAMPLALYRYLPPSSQYCVFSEKRKSTTLRSFIQERVLIEKKVKKEQQVSTSSIAMEYNGYLIQTAIIKSNLYLLCKSMDWFFLS